MLNDKNKLTKVVSSIREMLFTVLYDTALNCEVECTIIHETVSTEYYCLA